MRLLAVYLSCLCLLGVSTPRQPMVLSSDTLAFFSVVPGSTAPDVVQTAPSSPGAPALPSSPSAEPRKKKRRRAQASDLSAVVADDCCLKQCGRHFADSKRDDYSFDLLRAEHQRFQALESEPARKNFVIQKIPLQRKHKHKLFAGNRRVCGKFFKAVFPVSNNVIYAAKGTPGARASSNVSLQRPPRRGQQSWKREAIVSFVDWYSDLYGERMPHKPWTVLYTATKKELYQRFIENEQRVRGQDYRPFSASYFNKTWKKARPLVKVTKFGDFMKCTECTELNEKLHGAPGVQPVQDSHRRARLIRRQQAHHEMVSKDRQVLTSRMEAAKREQANGSPTAIVVMTVDAACQTRYNFPCVYPHCHLADSGYSERTKVMAVMVEGAFVDVHFAPLTIGGGSNLVCTAIWLALRRLSKMWRKRGKRFYIELLHFQVDNCVGENKNNVVMAFLSGFIAAGVIGAVEVHFLMVGHTHIKIDQVFSRFSVGTRGRSIFTRTQLGRLFTESYRELPVYCATLRNLGNFKHLFFVNHKLNVRKIKNITGFRAFRIEKHQGQVAVRFKQYMHSDSWNGLIQRGDAHIDGEPHLMFALSAPTFDNMPPFQLKRVDSTVIAMIKKRNEATRDRLESTFALAPDGTVEAVLGEQQRSLDFLRTGGSMKPFDLPTEWLQNSLPPRQTQGPLVPQVAATAGISRPLPQATCTMSRGKRRVTKPRSAPTPILPAVGDIVFFNAAAAPFVLGEVIQIAGSPPPGTVKIHWYGPVSSKVRSDAGRSTVAEYVRARFSKDFLRVEGKRATTPDVGDEPMTGIIACCERLTTNSNIPVKVQKVLASTCRPSGSSSPESKEGDDGDSDSAYSSDEEQEMNVV